MPKAEIHHPKTGKRTHGPHFVAYGRADTGVRIKGVLTGHPSNQQTQGYFVYLGTSRQDKTRKFWAIRFTVTPAPGDTSYTLQISEDVPGGGTLAQSDNVNITLSRQANSIAITYPDQLTDTGANSPPPEFMAYGTALASDGDVSGNVNNCDQTASTFQEEEPPADWTLYCNVVSGGASCTLTVSQIGVTPAQVTGLSFA